jgi:hypothetical protein
MWTIRSFLSRLMRPAAYLCNNGGASMTRSGLVGIAALLATAGIAPTARGETFAAGCGYNAAVSWVETKQNETINHCRCIPGHTRYIGACIPTACATAFNKLTAAQEGGRNALGALGAEAVAYPAAKILNWINIKGGATARLISYLDALKDAESGLDDLLAYYANRPVGNDQAIWQAIQTLNQYRRLVRQAQVELANNNCGSS